MQHNSSSTTTVTATATGTAPIEALDKPSFEEESSRQHRRAVLDNLRKNMFTGNPLDRLHDLRMDHVSHEKMDQLLTRLLLHNNHNNGVEVEEEEEEVLILPYLSYNPLLMVDQVTRSRVPQWKTPLQVLSPHHLTLLHQQENHDEQNNNNEKSQVLHDAILDCFILLGRLNVSSTYYFVFNLDRYLKLLPTQSLRDEYMNEQILVLEHNGNHKNHFYYTNDDRTVQNIDHENGEKKKNRIEFGVLREIALMLPSEEEAAIVAQGRALLEWSDNHRFCGACGSITQAKYGGIQRQCSNHHHHRHRHHHQMDNSNEKIASVKGDRDKSACGRTIYPRTDPVVIMLVIYGDKCLLGRQRQWPKGQYSCLAGFIDVGESIEEAVRREVSEETGVDVSVNNVFYFSSQPWPFLGGQMMIGCHAYANSVHIKSNLEEIEDAQWFSVEQVRQGLIDSRNMQSEFRVPAKHSVAHKLIQAWVEGYHHSKL